MPAPEGPIENLAGAILDGGPIDWESAESRVDGADRAILEQFKLLAALADLHRGLPTASSNMSAALPPGSIDGPMKLEHWGPLRVLEPIARGSFGEVYRAWDTRLDREVALKLLPARTVAGPGDATSVIHEGRLLARVRHPNVVAVYGAEQIENRIGLWMELVHGPTLEQALAAGRVFSVEEAVGIGVELCRALAAVHDAGLLHRDVKAHNVALADDGRVVLMDFGAGRDVTDSVSSDLAGTPLYLAPEIFEGRPASVRSDIYSLGVVLYHLVTNSYPAPGRTVKEVRENHKRGERTLLQHARPDLPESFVQVVERALTRAPEARYDSAAMMATALAAVVAVPAPPFPARPPRLVWSGVAAAVLLALLVGWSLLYRPPGVAAPTRSDWIQITNFGDSATSPALSPDGQMLTFIRGPNATFGPGQIYVKRLPDGQPVRLTQDDLDKMSPVFSPDGSRIAYTTVDTRTFRWDTSVVSVNGADPPQVLSNASGLNWIDSRRLLFSAIKSGIHMALVTATEGPGDVQEAREIYVPPHERGMVHRSALSPDGKWVLAAEMENQLWLPCRLLPFDGRDSGKPIGPAGTACTEAAWSPDGVWMYVNAVAGNESHIWRQRFPDGAPAQVTFGPTEESGLALAADGRSLITSVGLTTSSVWVHDEHGERQISSEGNGSLPGGGSSEAIPRGSYFSPEDQRLYYLIRQGGGATFLDGELWVADLASGRTEQLLPEFTVASFDLSDDGTRVVFAAADANGKPRLWLAPLDRRFPSRRLSSTDEDSPLFAPNGEIFFRASEGGANFLYRMAEDGTGRRKVASTRVLALHGVSPDGRWLVAFTPVSGDQEVSVAAMAYPTAGGPARRLCDQCKVSWSRDGQRWYLTVGWNGGRTYVVSLRPGESLPDLPAKGIRSETDLRTLPVIQMIDTPRMAPGRGASTYAFTRTTVQRNLYRIPLP